MLTGNLKRIRIEHGDGLLSAQFEKAKDLGLIVVQIGSL